MSEETPRAEMLGTDMLGDEATEQLLRMLYTSCYGQPPAPSMIWTRIDARIDLENTLQVNTNGPAFLGASFDPQPLLPPSASAARGRTRLAQALPALAAALVVALFASLLLGTLYSRGHGSVAGKMTPTPTHVLQEMHMLASDEILANADLNDVQMLSATDGWAVGDREVANGKWQTLILHYTNSRWNEVAYTIANAALWWVEMVTPDEGWAGGASELQNAGFLLHYSKGHWSQVRTPDGLTVGQIRMVSASDGWAIEIRLGDTKPPQFYLLHYSNGVWTRVSETDSHLAALDMLSSSAGWAAGQGGIIERYQNGMWRRWGQTAPGDVTTLQMVSESDGWLAGLAPSWDAPNAHLFVMHFDGQQWKDASLPVAETPDLPGTDLPSSVGQISMVSSRDGWMAGTLNGATSLLLHYSDGRWQLSLFSINMPLDSISMISTDEGWAVGSQHIHSSGGSLYTAAVIVHYDHGTWSVYKP